MPPNRLRDLLRRRSAVHSQWMLSSGALRAAIAFGANLVLVRFILPGEFGTFALRYATAGLVLSVVSLRTGTQVIRLNEQEVAEGGLSLYWNVLLQETAVAGVLAWVWLSALGEGTGLAALLLSGLLLQHLMNNAIAFYERGQPYAQIASIETVSVLAGHGIAVTLVLLGLGAGALYVRELVLALVIGAALAVAGGLPLERPRLIRAAEWRRVFADVRGIWLEGLLQGAFARVTILLAGAAGSAAAVGFFYQAHRLAVVPQQLLDPLTGRVALNWFSRAESEAERRRAGIRLLLLILPLLLACLVLAAWLAEWAIPLLFGEAWRPVAPLLLGLSGVIVFYSLFGVARTYLLASRRTRYLVTGSALQFVGLLLPTLAWLLGRPRDVMDVAWGLSLAYVLSFAFCAYFAWGKSGKPGTP